MTNEKMTPLRERMIEDMRIRGMGDKAQKAHIRAIKDFAGFLKRSPDTATPDDLRAYQLHMADTEVTPPTFNARIMALRFLFGTTCGREEMKRYMQFRTQPRKLPTVLSIEEVSEILAAAPGPGLKYRAAFSISYGAGLRASEVCSLKVSDIDSDRMLIHVDQGKGGKDRKVMLSPDLLDFLRNYWREAQPAGWLFPGKPKINPISARQLSRAFNSAKHLVGTSNPPPCTLCGTVLRPICWRQTSTSGSFKFCWVTPNLAPPLVIRRSPRRRSGTRPARLKHSRRSTSKAEVTDRIRPRPLGPLSSLQAATAGQ